ncbi:hypothetical protein Bca101_025822 [Brassica carinata]
MSSSLSNDDSQLGESNCSAEIDSARLTSLDSTRLTSLDSSRNVLKEEKEKKEKEMVQQQNKADFYSKRSITIDNSKKSNRKKEKLFLESQEIFYAEADKNSWKAIAELIPGEVHVLEKKGKKNIGYGFDTLNKGP